MKKETKLTQKMSSSGVAGVECHIAASVKLTDGDKVLLFPSQGVFLITQASEELNTVKLNQL